METQPELTEFLRTADEITDYDTAAEKNFYVLKELEAGHGDRIHIHGLAECLPRNEIRQNQVNNLTKEVLYLDVGGDYFPDFLEESGIYLVSRQFLEYLQTKIALRNICYNQINLVAENGKRIEEYFLLIPDELDCAMKQNARLDTQGLLQFFEIDEAATGALQIFKVKQFPHLIITAKLNRIEYSGFECIRIENYCDYEWERDRQYRERISGKPLQEAVDEYEKRADATGDINYKYSLRRVCSNHLTLNDLQRELRAGLKAILDSYRGGPLEAEQLSDRFLLFVWSWERSLIALADDHAEYFGQTGMILKSLAEAKKFIAKLPPDLAGPARQVCLETVTHFLATECKVFDQYPGIHDSLRFRLYLHDETSRSMNPFLIYDYKDPLQQKIEAAPDLRVFDLSRRDLREFDFSGITLSGMKIEDCDLRRAKLQNCILSGVEFTNCDLTGVGFQKSNLRGAKFLNCYIDRANFDGTIMNDAEFNSCYINHSCFIKSDLSGARFKNQDLSYNYFLKTKLMSAVFEIMETYEENVFRLCDLQGAKFAGMAGDGETGLYYCDFSNSNLYCSQFSVDIIAYSNFIGAQLNNADFSQGDLLIGCDFRFCSCFAMNIAELTVEECDFTDVNLAGLKIRNSTRFADNDFSYASLSRYDFTVYGYRSANNLSHTNLTNCKLTGADLRTSELIETNFNGAELQNAKFNEDQLAEIDLSLIQQKRIQVIIKEPEGDAGEKSPDPSIVTVLETANNYQTVNG